MHSGSGSFALGAVALGLLAVAGCDGPGEAPAGKLGVTRNASPAGPGSLAPHLARTPDGDAVLSWLEPMGADGHAVRFAVLRDTVWSSPVSVAAGSDWFVNYADFPSVVPLAAGRWAAHWLARQPGGAYAYDIAVSLSSDGGATWAEPFSPHDDGTPTEHGFVTLFPWADALGMVWLDGRNTASDGTSSPDTAPAEGTSSPDTAPTDLTSSASPDMDMQAGEAAGGMTLRYARFDDAGRQLEGGELDNLVCDCCQTDVAMSADGPVVAYRDRSATEVRDISVVRHAAGSWSAPLTISDDNWQIAACPVNGPAIDADGNVLVVAWYAAPERSSRVKMAWSRDGGRSFSAPVIVDEGAVSGRVDIALLDAETAAVSWVGKTADGVAQVRLRHMRIDGAARPIRVVAEGDFSRGTGFPQMIDTPSGLVFAWPEAGEPRAVHTGIE